MASLLLSFLPGTRDDNDYGGRPREGSVWALLLALIAMALSIGLSFRSVYALVEQGVGGDIDSTQSLPAHELASRGKPGYAMWRISASALAP